MPGSAACGRRAAGLGTVVRLFAEMAQAFRLDPRAARGYLMVNTNRRTCRPRPACGERGSSLRDSFREAFAAS